MRRCAPSAPIAGGPDQIHLAIKDALTDRGTMMMYASCPDYYDDVGRGVYPGSHERELLEKMPAFDALTARARARQRHARRVLPDLSRIRSSTITSPASWCGARRRGT